MARRVPDIEQMLPLVEAGYQLIPLHRYDEIASRRSFGGKQRNLGKVPIHKRWTTRRYENEDVLSQAARLGVNVGVRLTDEHLVVDIDPRSVTGGLPAAKRKLRTLGVNPRDYPAVATGSGGYHLYMRKPAGTTMRDHLPGEWRGIEFKSLGRQVVAPGSIHPNGRPYSWAKTKFDFEELWLGAPLAPEQLIKAGLKGTASKRSAACDGQATHSPHEIETILKHFDVEDFRDHDTWLRLMMSVHYASGGQAREEFVEWCETDPCYSDDGEEIRYRWDSLNRGGIGLGTLYRFMRQQGCSHLIDRRARIIDPDEFEDVA